MSVAAPLKRVTTRDIRLHDKDAPPLVALTAYTASVAALLDPHCDILLVGDSLGMTIYGMDSTLGVTLDMMIAHGQAVMRGSRRACVIIDMPFGSYQASPAQAFASAARIMAETGAAGVKLEGGVEMAETAAFLAQRGIPVMGHVGMKPQSIHSHGGFRAQGRDAVERAAILADALAIEKAGAFSAVLESTVEPVAREVVGALDIPVIGIGASPACAGQVLVIDDVIGLFSTFTPKFAKRYVDVSKDIGAAAQAYAADVRARRFPGPEHSFGVGKPALKSAQ